MKRKYHLIFLIVCFGLFACDSNLDLQENPNEVTPDIANVNDLYNNIQLEFGSAFLNAEFAAGQMSRMYHMGSFTYESAVSPATLNGLWFDAYSDLFPDMVILNKLAEEKGLDIHAGSAKIMKAYVLMAMVDNIGDVPLFEIGQGTDIISPKTTPAAEIYENVEELLTEAIELLEGTKAARPTVDNFYDGDAAKWTTLAKTLKLRAAVTTRLINPTAAMNTINTLLAEGDLIDSQAEDFAVQLSSNRSNPDSRHWMYRSHYETGDGQYLSNYYMWMLRADKTDIDGYPIRDPRLRYYFYRKVDDSNEQDPTTYSCHFSVLPTDFDGRPAHFDEVDERLPYCTAFPDGYIGRDHGNGTGSPPDGNIRTSFGLYPAGGQFDEFSFEDTRKSGTTGGKGAGIYPVLLSSFVDFLRAEAALTVGTNDDARQLLESGIRKSMAKVRSFEALVEDRLSTISYLRHDNITYGELYAMRDEDIDEYVEFVLEKYDAGNPDEKLDVLMKEYYIALWGNGLEAYNMYRRTGKPANMAPTLEPAGGNFVRSFFLPAVHVNRNANSTQKELTDLVFWDDGSAEVY